MLSSIMIQADQPLAKQIKASVRNNIITRKELAGILSNRGYYQAQEQIEGIKQCLEELKKDILKENNPFLFGILYPVSVMQQFFSAQEPVKGRKDGRRCDMLGVNAREGLVKVHESNGWLTLFFESKGGEPGGR